MDNNKHEIKICQNCNKAFECKVGDISHCQCTGVKFTEAEFAFILSLFNDCLCINCLTELKQQYHQQNFEQQIKCRFGSR